MHVIFIFCCCLFSPTFLSQAALALTRDANGIHPVVKNSDCETGSGSECIFVNQSKLKFTSKFLVNSYYCDTVTPCPSLYEFCDTGSNPSVCNSCPFKQHWNSNSNSCEYCDYPHLWDVQDDLCFHNYYQTEESDDTLTETNYALLIAFGLVTFLVTAISCIRCKHCPFYREKSKVKRRRQVAIPGTALSTRTAAEAEHTNLGNYSASRMLPLSPNQHPYQLVYTLPSDSQQQEQGQFPQQFPQQDLPPSYWSLNLEGISINKININTYSIPPPPPPPPPQIIVSLPTDTED